MVNEIKLPKNVVAPEPFTKEELEGVRLIRERLGVILHRDDFEDKLFLARLYRANNGDLELIRQRVQDLNSHQEALGYTVDSAIERSMEHELIQKVFERFSISNVRVKAHFSGDTLVFLQKMDGVDLKEILRVLPASSILQAYVLLVTVFRKWIRARERRTGRPAAVVSVLDLQGVSLRDYINPFSPSSQFARLVAKVWSDYFTEDLVRLYLVHPPGLVSLLWRISKHILDTKTQSQIVFVKNPEDLNEYLCRDTVPKAYGGNRVDNSGFCLSPESCVSAPKPVRAEEYFDLENFWLKNAGTRFTGYKTFLLKPGKSHEEAIECRTGHRIVWMFTAPGDTRFEIFREKPAEKGNNDRTYIFPRVTTMSVRIQEHGTFECTQSGTYIIRFENPASSTAWIPSSALKIQLAIRVV